MKFFSVQRYNLFVYYTLNKKMTLGVLITNYLFGRMSYGL